MVIHGGGNCFQRTKDSPHEAHNASRLRSRSARPTYNTRYKRKRTNSPIVASLPLGAQRISKHDFYVFEALFAHYLELQKQLTMSTMSDTEVRGRWKSFVGKWYVLKNRVCTTSALVLARVYVALYYSTQRISDTRVAFLLP